MLICVCLLKQQMETSGPCLGWVKYLRPPSSLCSLLLSLALSILSVCLPLSICVCPPHCMSLSWLFFIHRTSQKDCSFVLYLWIVMKAVTISKFVVLCPWIFACFLLHQYSFKIIYFTFPLCHRCIWQLFPFTEWEGLVGRHPHYGTCQHQRRTVLLHASHRPSCKIHHCL